MDLIEEKDHVPTRDNFPDHAFDALLKFAPVFGACDHTCEVQREEPLAAHGGRHLAVHDPLRESLDDRRLADAGLSHQARVVLRSPAQDLDDAADLVLPADAGVELSGGRELGQIPAVLREDALPRLLAFLARRLQVVPVLRRVLADRGQRLEVDLHGIDPERLHDLDADVILFQDQREQDVLRPDFLRAVAVRLFLRHIEDLLAARGESVLVHQGEVSALDVELGDHVADPGLRHQVLHEDPGGDAVRLADEAHQQMLRADVVLQALLRRLPCQFEYFLSVLRVIVFHPFS